MASKRASKPTTRGAKTIADIKRKSPPKKRGNTPVAHDPERQQAEGWFKGAMTRPSLNRGINDLGLWGAPERKVVVIERPSGQTAVYDDASGDRVGPEAASFAQWLAARLSWLRARRGGMPEIWYVRQEQMYDEWMHANGWVFVLAATPNVASRPSRLRA